MDEREDMYEIEDNYDIVNPNLQSANTFEIASAVKDQQKKSSQISTSKFTGESGKNQAWLKKVQKTQISRKKRKSLIKKTKK